MRKPGADEENILPSDFLCDFCGSEWAEELPMVEGHKGSLICGACLREAYRQVVMLKRSNAPEGYACTLCLLTKTEPAWTPSPSAPTAACQWCIERSAKLLTKDPESKWTIPN